MKLELKEFQLACVSEVLHEAALARGELAGGGKSQTLVLSSPTGSGKTLIATAFIERVLTGDDDHEADPDATFLWLSYQPDLNEQTRRKIAETTSVPDLITVTAEDFMDQEFEPGCVYFLNAQKLGSDKQLVTPSEERPWTIWDVFNKTASARRGSFYVIVDEAHKGTQAAAGEETIMQKFLLGSEGEIEPADLVLGISATPGRFQELLAGGTRLVRPIVVEPAQVRESGLLKDRVALFHPDEAGTSADHTLLGEATERLVRFGEEWAEYAKAEGGETVAPILVVQVENARGGRETATDLPAALAAIQAETGKLDDAQIAHAFQEGLPVEVDGRTIRHLMPADIDADPDVRVVFFKQSLNTGWDCPRAEAMMSFRRAQDRTHIAQLIGRMVRTPLARRVGSNEFLNSVALYLPRFDEQAVKEVVAYLTDPSQEDALPVEVDSGKEIVECELVDRPDLVAAYEELPSFTVARVKAWSDRRRLLKLGRALGEDEIEEGADSEALDFVLDALEAELTGRKGKKAFKDALKTKRELRLKEIDIDYGTETATTGAGGKLKLTRQSIDALFAATGHTLGNGLHLRFLKRRIDAGDKPIDAKLEIAALLDDPKAIEAVDAKTKAQVEELMATHRATRKKLPAERREVYLEIQRHSPDPERTELSLPKVIQVRRATPARKLHLYENGDGLFPGKLNTWESPVIDAELERDEVVGWLRIVDRKEWALCVPYEYEDRTRSLYPDLVVFRKAGKDIVVDILDPHRHDLDDAWVKVKGLAEYASEFAGDYFGRIQAIAVERDKSIGRIELTDEEWRKKALKVSSNAHLKELYEQAAESG